VNLPKAPKMNPGPFPSHWEATRVFESTNGPQVVKYMRPRSVGQTKRGMGGRVLELSYDRCRKSSDEQSAEWPKQGFNGVKKAMVARCAMPQAKSTGALLLRYHQPF